MEHGALIAEEPISSTWPRRVGSRGWPCPFHWNRTTPGSEHPVSPLFAPDRRDSLPPSRGVGTMAMAVRHYHAAAVVLGFPRTATSTRWCLGGCWRTRPLASRNDNGRTHPRRTAPTRGRVTRPTSQEAANGRGTEDRSSASSKLGWPKSRSRPHHPHSGRGQLGSWDNLVEQEPFPSVSGNQGHRPGLPSSGDSEPAGLSVNTLDRIRASWSSPAAPPHTPHRPTSRIREMGRSGPAPRTGHAADRLASPPAGNARCSVPPARTPSSFPVPTRRSRAACHIAILARSFRNR